MRERIAELNEDALFADGFDDALMGVVYRAAQPPVACYFYAECIKVLMKDGLSHEDAVDYFEYNVVGAYVGENTPVFMEEMSSG